MNPLLVEPTDEQRCLLDVIYRGRELGGNPAFQRRADDQPSGATYALGKRGIWPIFQYVEGVLYQEHGLEARRIIAECPLIPVHTGMSRYGWLWHPKPVADALVLNDTITLTIAGIARVPRASNEVSVFLDMLAVMVDCERAFVPSPTELQTVELDSTGLAARLDAAGKRWMLGPAQFQTLADLMGKEPSTWNCHFLETSDAEWRVGLSPVIRRYQGVTNGDEYVGRVVEVVAPPPPPAPLHPPSLSLPEAIDYLNAVWRAHAGTPLMRITRAEAASKLALDCATADEFEARLSAFAGIVGHLEVPGIEGHRLMDLKTYLEQQLEVDAAARANEAVDDLRAFIDVRVWRQHPGADERGREGARRLGVELPTGDWGGAWRYLQAKAVAALATLREEIESIG